MPCTIRQVLEAVQQQQDDDDFFVDGSPVNQVSIVGQILSTNHHPTNDTYLVDDCTGKIEVSLFHNSTKKYFFIFLFFISFFFSFVNLLGSCLG